MKLLITLFAGAVLIRFAALEPGTYYLVSTADGFDYRVEVSALIHEPSHISTTLAADEAHRRFFVWFEAESW